MIFASTKFEVATSNLKSDGRTDGRTHVRSDGRTTDRLWYEIYIPYFSNEKAGIIKTKSSKSKAQQRKVNANVDVPVAVFLFLMDSLSTMNHIIVISQIHFCSIISYIPNIAIFVIPLITPCWRESKTI